MIVVAVFPVVMGHWGGGHVGVTVGNQTCRVVTMASWQERFADGARTRLRADRGQGQGFCTVCSL